MTRDKDKKLAKEQQLLEAARLGHVNQLETILNQFHQLKTKKRSNPLASLRKIVGPNSIRDPVTGFTCLHHAALNGHSQCVQLIISHGGKLNAVDYKGSTALHLAAWSGNLQVVKTLMGFSAAATSTGSYPATSFETSTSSTTHRDPTANHQQQIKSSSSPAKQQSNKSASQQQQQQLQSLDGDCFQEIELNHLNNDCQTALSLAAQFGHSQVVAELLRHGTDPNLRNNQLESPLDLACLNGHLETARLILNASPHLVNDLRKSHSTISISATYSSPYQQQLAHKDEAQATTCQPRRPGASGWSSLLRGATIRETSPPTAISSDSSQHKQRRASSTASSQLHEKLVMSQQHSLDSSPAASLVSERLLDHSPLHYAVRRGHLAIVDLLLNQYEANLYQLTSLGSVMHEMVMSVCSSGDSSARGARKTSNLLNGDLMRVFLAHLSRLSSGDPQKTQTRWQHLLSARDGQMKNVFDIIAEVNTRPAHEFQRTILELSSQLDGMGLVSQQQQQLDLQLEQHHQRQEQIFSNSRQINSFATMGRAPKSQRSSKSSRTALMERNDINQYNQQQAHIDGTQTIDRRKTSSRGSAQQPDLKGRQISSHHFDMQQQQQEANLTRSVSSVIQNFQVAPTANWSHFTGLAQHQSAMVASDAQTGRKRSKSRDLGSLLMEANHQQNMATQMCSTPTADQLYDNQLLPSVNSMQLPPGSNQLVRSQTDCSHLLGRLFVGVGQEQPVAQVGDAQKQQVRAAEFARQNYFKQNQHAHSSDSSSLISGLEQRRLVPTSIAQQHSATLDRRAINRHYHVYDHEFYPPRLVEHQAQHSYAGLAQQPPQQTGPDHRQRQAVAIVPPTVRKNQNGSNIDGTAQNSLAGQTLNNSRLSLNMDRNGNHLADSHESQLNGRQQQHDQMNRFVGRSRKSSQQAGNEGPSEHFPHDKPGYQHQPLLQARPQSMHSSQSLESRLGAESQLFESTRRALMRDFDKMIGRELLNNSTSGEFCPSDSATSHSRGTSRRKINSSTSSSQNSILTGISLDMDTRGEHLIVSGTRITLPEPQVLPSMNQSASSGSMRSPPLAQNPPRRVSPRAADSSSQTQAPTNGAHQTSGDNNSLCSSSSASDERRLRPTKPPRPSLESQQIYRSLKQQRSQDSSPVIYDQPSHADSSSNLVDPTRRPGSRTSMNSSGASMLQTTPSMVVPPPVPPQPKPRASGAAADQQKQQQVSMTEPPTEKPPPPPVVPLASPLMSTPLEVITSGSSGNNHHRVHPKPLAPGAKVSVSSSSSSNSPTSSTSSSFRPLNQRPDLLISSRGRQRGKTAANSFSARAPDVDSGVCTSDSPASMSHDSGSGTNPRDCPPSKPVACLGSEVPMAPPSPRTAQMSIEEALMPLDENAARTPTQETANQTRPTETYDSTDVEEEEEDDDDENDDDVRSDVGHCFALDEEIEEKATSIELGSQVEMVFGWLSLSNKTADQEQFGGDKLEKSGYENCLDLQERIKTTRCQSIENLFREIKSGPDRAVKPSPSSVDSSEPASPIEGTHAMALNATSEDGDYAALSEENAPQSDQTSSSAEDSPSMTFKEAATSADDSDQSSKSTPARHGKEIMLRIVVDESQQASGGDDVFYISPLELQKISTASATEGKVANVQGASRSSETGTLTDEELCASVDKSSGYIRFTLRKRRGSSDTNGLDRNPPSLSSAPEQMLDLGNDETPSDTPESSAKRTKMNSDEEISLDSTNPTKQADAKQMSRQGSEENAIEPNHLRKASKDSVLMDTSQASSTSSTSEMSIKSIVSLKTPQPEAKESPAVVPVPAEVPSETQQQIETVGPATEISVANVSPAQSANDTSGLNSEREEKLVGNQQVEEEKPAERVTMSIVSETARRLEAAVAAKASGMVPPPGGKPPTALARRSLHRRSQNAETLQQQSEKENVAPPAANAPPPFKRSICWPPQQKASDERGSPTNGSKSKERVNKDNDRVEPTPNTTTSTPTGPVIGRVSANRLSFQRLIEETNRAAMQPQTLNRPKPPPPIKPAGLIVPQKFKNQMQ